MELQTVDWKLMVRSKAAIVAVSGGACGLFAGTAPFSGTPSVLEDAQRQFFSGLHSVFSEVSLLDGLGWNTPRFWVNIVILSIVAGIVVLAIVMSIRRTVQKKAETARELSGLYSASIARCGLTSDETGLLESMARRKNVTQPHTIFQSYQLFEECVDAEVRWIKENDAHLDEKKMRDLFSDLRLKMGFMHLPLEFPLVSTRNISLGQVGSLFSAGTSRMLFRKVSVMENTAFFLTVKYNVDHEEVHRLTPGQTVRFAFARRNDGLYGIQTAVVKLGRPGVVDLYHTLDIKRNQLRQYVRIETNLPLALRLLKTADAEKSEIKTGESLNARLSDVSGGGLSFVFDRSLRLGDLISLSFNLPGAPCAGIMGKIVHLSLCDIQGKTCYRNHVQFLNIESRKREKIISYVFEKERQANQWR
jgi:hypothetical protein